MATLDAEDLINIANAVWDEILTSHIDADSASLLLQAIKTKTDLIYVPTINITSPVDGDDITLLRGDTFDVSINGLGDLTDYISIDFTVKHLTMNTDDEAIIRVRKNASGIDDGLLRLNKLVGTANQGSITVSNLIDGNINILIDALATKELELSKLQYDIQVIYANKVRTATYGTLTVTGDITMAVL